MEARPRKQAAAKEASHHITLDMNLKDRQIIVHIGMPKTGSTSIQACLNGYQDDDFYYASLGDSPNHSVAIFSLFSPVSKKHHYHLNRGHNNSEVGAYIETMRHDLEQSFENAAGRSVIISGEGIGSMSNIALTNLRDYLLQYCVNLKVVCYVRPPASYMQSSFQQRIKSKYISFCKHSLYKGYKQRLTKIEKAFGREACEYWKFDPSKFSGGDVVTDFCERLNIDTNPIKTRHINDSLPLDALKILFAYRKHGPGYGRGKNVVHENSLVINSLREIGSGRLTFGKDLIEPLLKDNKEDIAWMESRLGESLDEEIMDTDQSISKESDLLDIGPGCIEELKKLIGQKELTDTISGSTPQEVAQLVHILRNKLSGKPIHDGVLVKPSDHLSVQTPTSANNPAVLQNNIGASALVDALKSKDSKILDGIPDRRA